MTFIDYLILAAIVLVGIVALRRTRHDEFYSETSFAEKEGVGKENALVTGLAHLRHLKGNLSFSGLTKISSKIRSFVTTSLLVALGALAAISAYVWVSFPSARPYLLPIALPIGGAVVISSLVAEKVKSDLGKLALVSLTWVAVLVFAIIPTLMSAWRDNAPQTSYIAPAGPKLTPRQAAELERMHAVCPSKRVPFSFLHTFTPINEEGLCLAAISHPLQCIFIRDDLGIERGPYCDRTGSDKISIPYRVRAARSANQPFDGHIELRPNKDALSFILE